MDKRIKITADLGERLEELIPKMSLATILVTNSYMKELQDPTSQGTQDISKVIMYRLPAVLAFDVSLTKENKKKAEGFFKNIDKVATKYFDYERNTVGHEIAMWVTSEVDKRVNVKDEGKS